MEKSKFLKVMIAAQALKGLHNSLEGVNLMPYQARLLKEKSPDQKQIEENRLEFQKTLRQSIKVTTIRPSGPPINLLGDTACGIHPIFTDKFIRRAKGSK